MAAKDYGAFARAFRQDPAKRLGPCTSPSGKTLVVLDFDHTVVEGNTDVEVRGKGWEAPAWMRTDAYKAALPGQWTRHMGEVLSALHTEGVSREALRQRIVDIPETKGFEALLKAMAAAPDRFDVLVASDSNSLFIHWWLHSRGISVTKVCTNPAEWEGSSGPLRVAHHHAHSCDVCAVNLCKGKVVEDFSAAAEAAGTRYAKRLYAGDGQNDLCPLLRLANGDVAAVRKGFSLQNITKGLEEGCVAATTVLWDTADELRPHLGL